MGSQVYHTDIHSLRQELHKLDAVLLTAPPRRVGTKWWTRGWEDRHALRAQITQAEKVERSQHVL